ncbi:retention module-containing protein, partial [Pseudomonas sp.]|uniref:retention module-containing protein n=1 Tax=Pseudomonas sp. TaxID=306 RepID=UPI0032659FBD
MSSVVAIVKSIVGQVFAVSPEGIRRVLVEGDRLFVGDQVDTGAAGAVTLELADGRTLDLGRDTQWSGSAPDSSTDLAQATAQAAPSVEELQQAIVAGADPTKDLEATAAGPAAAGTGGAAGGGHSFVMLDATAGRVDPTIGFPTAGIGTAALAAQNTIGGQTANSSANVQRESTLTLSATPTITEAGGVLVYTATLTQAPLTDLTITLSNGSVIVIQAGQLTGTVNVPLAPNDTVYNDPTQINVSVTGTTGGSGIIVTPPTTPAVTQVTDTVDTTTVTLTAGANVTEGGQITYTATLTNPAQTPVTITLSNGSIITIDAGNTTGSVNVPTPANDVYNNGSTVTTTITGATGGNFESLVPNPAPAVTTIQDSVDNTGLTLTATDSVAEGGQIAYTATLSNPAGTPVTVTLSNGAVITIAAGATTGSVSVPAPADDVYKDVGKVEVTIKDAAGGNFENLVPSTVPAVTEVTDTINTSTVSLTANDTVAEGGTVVYTASVSAEVTGSPVVVTLSNGQTITIPVGSSSASVNFTAPNDALAGGGSLSVKIDDAKGGNYEKLEVNSKSADTSITDTTDTTTVSLSATESVAEGGSIVYTANLTHAAGTPVTVTLSNGAVITIAADATSGSVTVAAPKDDAYIDAGKVSATISTATGGNFEHLVKDPATAVTSVTDTLDTSTVTLTATGSVAEGGTVVYTASVGAPVTGSPVVVTLSNGQTITIGIGKSSGTVNAVVSNDVLSGHAPLTNSITKVSGGNYENLIADKTPVSTSVTDTVDTTTLSLSATGNVKEGGQITYTATLTHAAGTPVTVTLSNGATITIDAGKTTGTVKVDAPKDDVYKDAGKLEVTIKDAAGGNFENLVTSPTPAVTNVADTVNTTHLTLSAEKSVLEGSHITYTATLTNTAQTPVTVKLSNGETITIDAGKTTGSVTIAAPSDDVYKDAGKLTVTMTDATGGNFEKLDISKASTTTTVKDTIDSTSLSLSASHTVSEGGQITYTATLSNPTDTAMTVKLSNGAVINIAAGATTGSVNFDAPANTPYIDGGKVQATIASQSGGNFEKVVTDHSPAVTTVTDSADTTGLSLSATGSVAEGGSIVYTATLTNAAGSAMTVTLNNGAVIHIAKGATTGSVNFAAPKDDVYKDAGKVEASITKTAGGNFENLVADKTPAVTDVTDTLNTSTVSLTANSTVAEGGTVVYTASVNAPVTGSPVVVTLSNGQSITIPVGASSASVKFTAPNDALAGGGSLSVKIDGTTGGNYENLVANQAPAVTSVTDVKDTTTLSLSATGSVAEGGSIVYTANLTHAAGTPVTVTLSNGAVITIAANATSGSVTVKAPADDVYKDAGKVEATIKDATGGNFENLVTSPAAAVTAVTDTLDTSTVSLTANGTVAEGGTVVYTASVSAEVTGSPVVVTLSNGQTITIPVGSSSASVNFTAPNDALAGGGSLSVKIDDAKGGNYEKLEVNGKSADTSITDTTDTTTVSLSATDSVAEGGSIVYTATLTHAAGTPVTVNLSNGAVITIAANATSGSVTVKAPADDVYKDAGKVEATIKDATGGNFENLVTSPAAAVTEVTDTINTSTVSLTANGTVAEGGTVVYTASVSAEVTGSPVVVTLSNGQTITIPVGSSSASVNFVAPNDALTGGGSLSVKINDAKGGNYEKLEVNGKSADTSITDTVDTTTLSLGATDSVAEGGSIVYTATLTNAAGTPVTVTLSNGAVITIAANATSGSVTVKAPADDVYKDAGKVEATIKGASGGNFENLVTSPAAAVTEVTDTLNTSTVSLKATPTAAEGGNVVYTASVTSKVTGKDVVVTLANGEKITIPVGESTASITVKAPNDVLVGHEPLTNAIKDVTGGNYENLVTDKTPTSTAISDTLDTTKVTMTASGQVLEGGNITYTANLTNAAGSDMTIKLSNGESIVIKAGDKSGSITVPAPADDVYKDGSKITVRIDSTIGGDFEKLDVNKTAQTTTVKDTIDTTTLKLSADVGTVGEGGQINYTATLNHPADTAMTVTLNNGLVINIKAGESSGSASFTVPNNVYIGAADVRTSIKETTGGNFEKLDTDPSVVVTKVTDTADTTSLTLSASGSVQEGGQIVYTATLSQAAGSNMTVKLSNGATITILKDAVSGHVSVAAPKDDVYKDAGKVEATIKDATGGNFENLVPSTVPAVTEVTDTINTSTVSLTANGTVAEGGTVVYTASVSAEVTGSPVVVTLSNGQTITIPVGASSASVNFTAPNDALAGGGSLSVKIDDAKGGNFEKLSIDSKPADTAVSDTVDTTKVTMTASDYVVEGGTITYTVNLSNAAGTDMTVKLSNGESVVIKAGDKSGSITLPAPADDVYKDGSKITVGIAGTSGGNFEKLDVSQTTHTTTVNDTLDTTTLKLSADVSTVGEGGQILYTATLSHPADTAMTVTLNNGLVINIKAGESSGSVPYTVPNDVYTGAPVVRAAIADSTGGNFEKLDTDRSAVVTKVTDTADTTSLTLSASGSVQEGGQIVYTATLSHAAGSDMTVKLSNGAVITILKDAVSGHVSVDAPKDDVYLDAGKVTASIDEVSGGKFESLVPDKSLVSTDITDTINDVVAKLTVDNASVTEGGKVTYTVTLTNADGLPVNNHGDLSFTLTDGTVVKVAANQTSGSTVVTTQDNHYVNQPVTVVNQLTGVSGTNTFENLVLSADKTSVTITDNDHAPVSAGGAVAGLEDSTITLSWNDFKVTDLDNDSPLGITITQVSGGGTLLFNGAQVTLGQTISQADIALGKLTFVPAANESGADGFGGTGVGNKASDYAQIQFKPIDGFNQGTEATLKVDITPVADAPTLNVAGNNVTSTGLIKEVWTGLSGLGTDGNGAATNTLKSVIDGAGTPNSSSTVSNVQSEGDVAQGTASKTSGLIYLEAGKTYTFSGTGDDSLLVTIGGKNVAATTWGAGANLNGSFTPSASGYYTLDIYHHNQNGPGNYDVNLSVNGSPAVDLSSAGVPIYTGVADLTHGGVTVSDLHGSNGEGYYEGYKLNEGAQGTSVHLSAINTALTDTDGSEILSVKISGIPAGSVLTDGAGHTFTATATSGEANVTGWSLGTLTVTPPANYNGQFNLTVTSTSTETLGGSAPSTATIPVTVYPTDPVSEVVATLTVDKTSVAEGGQITYTVTLSNKDGIAISSHDELTFKLSDGTLVKVPANAASGSFSINAPDDILMGGQPAIVNKLESVSGADNFQQLTLAQNSTQTAVTDESGSGTSIDNQGDKVGITIVGNGAVLENQAPSFTIKLDKAQAVALTVKLSDGQTVTFAAGETEKVHTLAPQGEDVYKDGGTATLGISGATSGGTALENLVVGNPASVVITDTLSEVVANLTVDKTTVAEGGSVTYTVTLTNKDGIAIGNHDALTFKLTDGTIVTVPANSTSGSATVVTKDDVYTGGQTSLVNKLESVTGSDNFEKLTLNDAKLTTTVTDEPSGQGEQTTLGISGATSVNEGQAAHYTLTLSNTAQTEVTVTLKYTGTATNGVDYTGVVTVKIPANSNSVGFDINTIHDKLVEGTENFKIAIDSVSGGNFESLVIDSAHKDVSTNIVDNDHAPVSVGGAVAGLEDSTITLTWDNFKVTDVDNDSPLSITITQVSAGGTLLFNGMQVSLGQTISQADIALGKLTFLPATNASGANGYGDTGVGNQAADYAQIKFKPTDGFNQGTEATLKVDITPVADAPTLNVASNNVTSTGLIKEVWTGLSGLGTNGNGAATGTLKTVIDGAGTPNSSGTVTNVQSDGSVAAGTASKTSGLIYLEAGKTYTFSGTGDDSLLVTI